MWKNFCTQNVFYCCKVKKDGSQEAPQCRVPLRFKLVAHFLGCWNGLSLLRSTALPKASDYCIQTDASGSWGCGAYFHGQWFQLQWDTQWKHHHIMVKESLPIVLSAAVWGLQLGRQRVMFQCDNSSVVTSLN